MIVPADSRHQSLGLRDPRGGGPRRLEVIGLDRAEVGGGGDGGEADGDGEDEDEVDEDKDGAALNEGE